MKKQYLKEIDVEFKSWIRTHYIKSILIKNTEKYFLWNRGTGQYYINNSYLKIFKEFMD